MSLITLTTDFGTKDHFVGAIKGAIYSELNDAKVVDVSHQITPFNITETAYILKNAYRNFPKGSIHIIDVDSELSVENKHIAIALDGHYFICADNGVISMIASEIKPDKMVEITIHNTLTSSSAFVKVACHIARGSTLEVIGKPINEFKQLNEVYPYINKEQNQIVGTIIYIDNYGNVICNITQKLFNDVGKGRPFEVSARHYNFKKVFKKYNEIINFEVPQEKRQYDGEKLALFNASDYLEIAIYKSNLKSVGGASTLLGLDYRDSITVRFL
ncbi:SAM-dependent chlorinase/fluorinase [Aureibaculum sp. 2210JD6-5]|uniref:SAM hydrolase/SAM-dependent halogenase family protein n=1 Tax=Aureibaculum sp. 2210JD6-5 TaxID=3103957 RepID=UPI002AAD52BB|nr:SAM-dependent chlorinase/fluorinase [Aureibaculum sp. 2210JD6-5]MDY7396649.1 SAM-dependent chlorinase/fluorinase [Aureibaculum sp. 2210JD6-5]